VYFGEQLTNDGHDVVEIRAAEASGDNVADVTIHFDVEGPAVDQAVGTFAVSVDGETSSVDQRRINCRS
jgi:hypothetical protein